MQNQYKGNFLFPVFLGVSVSLLFTIAGRKALATAEVSLAEGVTNERENVLLF
jgi:hypothetical protein